MEANLSVALNPQLKGIVLMKLSVHCTVGPCCKALWPNDSRHDRDLEIQHWHLRVLNRVFNFNLNRCPLAVLTQQKAKGRFDNDLFNLIDVDCRTGPFSLQNI